VKLSENSIANFMVWYEEKWLPNEYPLWIRRCLHFWHTRSHVRSATQRQYQFYRNECSIARRQTSTRFHNFTFFSETTVLN